MIQEFINLLIKTIPIIITNVSPVLTAKAFPKLKHPIDFNKGFLGSHKTWRGLITMILVGMIIGYLIVGLNYGIRLTIGVIIGDLITSFIKRKLKLKSGESFQPYDSEILALSVLAVTWNLFNIYEALIIIVLSPLFYKAFNYLGYKLRLQKNPW